MARASHDSDPLHGGAFHVPRSRGALSGVLLLALGIWGALICFVGPYFSFAFTPDSAWKWTSARGWLEVLPGTVTFVGAVLLLISTNRVIATFGAWLSAAGGAWFIVGPQLADLLKIGTPGTPSGNGTALRAVESLAFFAGLGALILFIAASALGRLSVRSVRDLRAAQRREAKVNDAHDAVFAEGQREGAAHSAGSDGGLVGPDANVEGGDGRRFDGQSADGRSFDGQSADGRRFDGQGGALQGNAPQSGDRQWVDGQRVDVQSGDGHRGT